MTQTVNRNAGFGYNLLQNKELFAFLPADRFLRFERAESAFFCGFLPGWGSFIYSLSLLFAKIHSWSVSLRLNKSTKYRKWSDYWPLGKEGISHFGLLSQLCGVI